MDQPAAALLAPVMARRGMAPPLQALQRRALTHPALPTRQIPALTLTVMVDVGLSLGLALPRLA